MPRETRSGSPARPGGEGAPRPAAAEDPGPRIRPAAAILLGLEALLLMGVATYSFVMVAAGVLPGRLGVGLGVFLLVFAAGAGLAARSVLAKGRFGQGYGLTWQLFQALVGASLLRVGMSWPGGIALVLAVVVFVLLMRLVRSTPLPHRGD